LAELAVDFEPASRIATAQSVYERHGSLV
jgi:hypothetical protein